MWAWILFILTTWLSIYWLLFKWLQIRQPGERVKVIFSFPVAKRMNFTLSYKAGDHVGPFCARSVLLRGRGLSLTRDSVDGLPDGKDPNEVVAPMQPAPLGGGGLFRMVGMIGIEGKTANMSGRLQVEIFNTLGIRVAQQLVDF